MERNRRKDLQKLFKTIKDSPAVTEKIKNKIKNKLLLRIVIWLFANSFFMFIVLAVVSLVVFVVVVFMMFSGLFIKDESGEYSPSYVNGIDYKTFFSKDALDLPYGIPVERGIITYGFDDGKYLYGIPSYPKHQGLDIAKIFKDKIFFYNPFIFSTHRGVVIQVEQRKDSQQSGFYTYTKHIYIDGVYSKIDSEIKKNIADKRIDIKPYGNHVILSTADGRFYTMYAHMSNTRGDLINRIVTERGDIIGNMGNTGNSYGAHLHYEIRYCGENNTNYNKSFRNCKAINPLSIPSGLTINYLGIDPSKNRTVYAGNYDKKNEVIAVSDFGNDIKKQYKDFCDIYKMQFISKKVTCKEVFPIIYQNRNNEYFPGIQDENLYKEAGEKYIQKEYGISTLNLKLEDIGRISLLENLDTNFVLNNDVFFRTLGKKSSFGKYNNRFTVYKKEEIVKKSSVSEIKEKELINDLIDALSEIKRGRSLDIENIYINYYGNEGYKKSVENPYVYNFNDKNNIYLYIRDKQGNNIGVYREYGAYTIYKKLDS